MKELLGLAVLGALLSGCATVRVYDTTGKLTGKCVIFNPVNLNIGDPCRLQAPATTASK